MSKQIYAYSTYSAGTKKVLKQLLRNAIKAIDCEAMKDAGDLGILANHLGRIAYAIEAGYLPDHELSSFDVVCVNVPLEAILRQLPDSLNFDWDHASHANAEYGYGVDEKV